MTRAKELRQSTVNDEYAKAIDEAVARAFVLTFKVPKILLPLSRVESMRISSAPALMRLCDAYRPICKQLLGCEPADLFILAEVGVKVPLVPVLQLGLKLDHTQFLSRLSQLDELVVTCAKRNAEIGDAATSAPQPGPGADEKTNPGEDRLRLENMAPKERVLIDTLALTLARASEARIFKLKTDGQHGSEVVEIESDAVEQLQQKRQPQNATPLIGTFQGYDRQYKAVLLEGVAVEGFPEEKAETLKPGDRVILQAKPLGKKISRRCYRFEELVAVEPNLLKRVTAPQGD